MSDSVEKPLSGGHLTSVSRLGKDVLREAGPWTPTIQRLLAHLRSSGLDWCPEPRGWTADGREQLSYLKGKVPEYPLPEWVYDERILIDAATRLRELHDATVGYHDPDALWRAPIRQPAEVVCHNDFAPYNMVFRDHRLTGVIDWDFASPGPRVWDLAYLAYRLVPLMRPESVDAPNISLDLGRRMRLLLDTYGSPVSVTGLLDTVIHRLEDLADFTHSHALARKDKQLREHALAYSADAAHLRSLLS